MAISTPQVSVDAAISATSAVATASATQLDAAAARATVAMNDAIARMNHSHALVDSVGNPIRQESMRNAIQGLQSHIQQSIDMAASEANQYSRAAQVARGLSHLASGATLATTAFATYDAAQSGDAQQLGGAVLGSLLGTLAGGIATAAFAGSGLVFFPIVAGAAAAIFAAVVIEEVVPDSWKQEVGEFYQHMRWGLTDFLIAWDPFDRLSDGINQDFNSAKNWTPARRDPLALDLDGDGIETLGADGTVVFDHDGDGVKTGTGWVGADDAFLALDRNGNGSIDTGAELFGVDTVKTDGSLAVDGFDALRDLDANGDGVFDTRDSEFANVRVWRDRDRDGVSDPGELSSLTDAGILSIDLNAAHNNVDLGNGNVQTATAAHLTTAGEAGTTGNLDLAHNPFYREFTHAVALTEQAMGLPDSRGSGRVRDLREAISLSPALAAIVSAYAEQTTYAEQREQLDALLRAWAGTSTMATSIERALANNFHLTYLMPGLSAADFLAFPRADKDNPGAGLLTLPDEEAAAQRQALLRQQARITGMIAVLERFNGDGFVTVEAESVVTGAGRRISLTPDAGGSSGLTVNPLAPSHAFVTLSQRQIDLLTQSYEQLKASVYGTLAMQTRLADYAGAVQLSVGGGGDMGVDFTAMNALLDAKSAANPSAALGDLIELVRYAGKSFHTQGWDGMDRLRAWIREGVGGEQAAAVLAAFNVRIADGEFTGTGGHDILFGDEQGNTLRAMAGNDIVDAGAGDDSVHGEGGDDFLIGGAGRDRLYGGAGNDTLRGGAGANDYLRGDSGDDTYLFGSGDGNTTVFNYDPGAGRNDVLRFLDGINPGDVKVTRSSNNLLLAISGTGK